MADFESIITQVIPLENMFEARERAKPAHVYQNYVDSEDAGFRPAGSNRPTLDMLPLKR
jgi:hypothetical protein